MENRRKQQRLSNEERRAQIIDIALSIFAEKGFNGAKTRTIAERAGISEAIIYKHFKTKEDLYRTALGGLLDVHSISIDSKESIANRDDYGVFKTFASHVFQFYQRDPRSIRLILFSALEGSPVTNAFRPRREKTTIEILADYIQLRIKEGAFRKVNPNLASQLFIEALVMFIIGREASLSNQSITFSDEETIDTTVKIFMQGLEKLS